MLWVNSQSVLKVFYDNKFESDDLHNFVHVFKPLHKIDKSMEVTRKFLSHQIFAMKVITDNILNFAISYITHQHFIGQR